MEENAPFHQSNRAEGQSLIEPEGLSVEATKQIFLYVKVEDEEHDAQRVHQRHASTVCQVDHEICEKPGVPIEHFYNWVQIKLIQIILK